MLALWLPVTGHCELETIEGLEFLNCESAAPSDSHCDNDGCETVEIATYRLQDNHADFEITILFLACLDFQTALADPCEGPFFTSPPFDSPELSRTWQFVLRTALSPRAPSFVS